MNVRLRTVARAGLMLSQVWPDSREKEGETARAIEAVLSSHRFDAIQTVEIPQATERRRVSDLLANEGYQYTYCLSRVLNENNHNLSSLDKKTRIESCDATIRQMDHAREAGADSLSIVSGPRPETEQDRQRALKALADSMKLIVQVAIEQPPLTILLEPLDMEAHKKFTLGRTAEALEICQRLADERLPLHLTLDSAHILLNNEAPLAALQHVLQYAAEYHFCNCVTDETHPLYGDHHIPFGSPGIVDIGQISEIMKSQVEIGFLDEERRPALMCEVYNRNETDPNELMHYCIDVMERAWEAVDFSTGGE